MVKLLNVREIVSSSKFCSRLQSCLVPKSDDAKDVYNIYHGWLPWCTCENGTHIVIFDVNGTITK